MSQGESRYLSKTQFSCGVPNLMPSCSQFTEGVLRWERVQQGSKFYQLRGLTLFHEIFQQTQRLHTCNVIVHTHTHTHTHTLMVWQRGISNLLDVLKFIARTLRGPPRCSCCTRDDPGLLVGRRKCKKRQ